MDSSCRTLAFRSSIIIALATAVATILYLTPLPDQYPQKCSRTCHELDWPLICRIKLTLEKYQTLGAACNNCPHNITDCYSEMCISVDGQIKGILASNRKFPGPTLQVCQNDIIVVDIVNRIPGHSFGVHWRGQPQSETPYMDGVPMITQCPIPSLTTFQYKFRASKSGTHMWQVNTGDEISDTLFGPLIVKKPDSREIHKKYYDTDDESNVVVVHLWNPDKTNFFFQKKESKTKLLINGKSEENGLPATIFKVSSGKRHRFRVIFASGIENCQIRLSIDKHQLLVISLDGHSIKPKIVTSVRMFPGERLDFVLRTDQEGGSYYFRATPFESCDTIKPTFALIRYADTSTNIVESTYKNKLSNDVLKFSEMGTFYEKDCNQSDKNQSKTCIDNIKAVSSIPEDLSKEEPNTKLYFFYDSVAVSSQQVFNTSFIATEETVKVPQVNNLTMMLPSSPLLSQIQQINNEVFCNSEKIPKKCKNSVNGICECVHMVDIPLNSVVELVLVNLDTRNHVFHLHGYSFHVIGMSKLPSSRLKPEKIRNLDKLDLLVKRNFNFPIVKDTINLADDGVAVVRFKADNPGYWLLDEENTSPWSKGMSLVLHVGKKSDLSPVPQNFPQCGDWIGPEYFLV